MSDEQIIFDALSDPLRRQILALLMAEGELCVCELQHALDVPQPKVSRHLGVLREADMISVRREGTWMFYRLHAQLPLWEFRILEAMNLGMEQLLSYQESRNRLRGMSNRPLRCCA